MGYSIRFLPHVILFLGSFYMIGNGLFALSSRQVHVPFAERHVNFSPAASSRIGIALIVIGAWCLYGFFEMVRYSRGARVGIVTEFLRAIS